MAFIIHLEKYNHLYKKGVKKVLKDKLLYKVKCGVGCCIFEKDKKHPYYFEYYQTIFYFLNFFFFKNI